MMTREQLIWAISEMENGVDRKNIADHDQAQRAVIARLEAEHKDLVLRNKLLRDRPDLPLERIQAYDEVITKIEQQAKENKALREALQALLDAWKVTRDTTEGKNAWIKAMQSALKQAQQALKEVSG